MSLILSKAFTEALVSHNKLPEEVREIEGLSGQAYRSLLNQLLSTIAPARYLEIGSWQGSTVISALFGNMCQATCVDNWSQFGGPKHEFEQNLQRFQVDDRVQIIEDDFRNVNYGDIGGFDVFQYDGPHKEIDHFDGIMMPQPALKQEYFLLVDDWNWLQVRLGTLRALSASRSTIEFAVEVRTTDKDDYSPPARSGKQSQWHYGCLLAVIKKGR